MATVKSISANDMNWLLDKVKQYDKSIKIHSIIEIFLTILDVIFCLLTLLYVNLLITFAVTSLLCGGVAGSRAVLVLRLKRLLDMLRLPATLGLTYVIARKKRNEFMESIKIRNWVIAILNAIAIVFGVVMVFVEPSAITNNIEAVICGLGALLGVNIAIPCFNNAKVSQEELEAKQQKTLEKQAIARVRAEQKAQEKELVEAEKQKIVIEQEQAKAQAEAEAKAQATSTN